jgi:hypothetical protein
LTIYKHNEPLQSDEEPRLHPSHHKRNEFSAKDDQPRLRLIVMGVCLFIGSVAAPAWALSVGGPEVQSKIGQPLKVRIPLSLQPGEELNPDCVRSLNPKGDDAPAVVNPRLVFDSLPRPAAVLLTTRSAVAEPAVRFAVQVGCDNPITKEFVVLLEPPGADDLRPPVVSAAAPSGAPAPVASSSAPQASAAPAKPSGAPAAAGQTRPAKSASGAAKASRPASAAEAPPARRPQTRPTARRAEPAPGDQLRLAPAIELGLAGGDLKLSSELRMSSIASLSAAPDATTADPVRAHRMAIEQARLAAFLRDEDPVAAVIAKEKELAARLGQVGGELEKARGELSRAEAAKAPATPAAKPAPAPAVAPQESFFERWWAWLLAGGAVALGVLLLVLSTVRRKRQTEQWWASIPESDSPESVLSHPAAPTPAPRRAAPVPAPEAPRTVPIGAGGASAAPASKEFFETSTFEMTQAAQREVLAKMNVEVVEHHELGHDTAAALKQATHVDTVPLHPGLDEPTRDPDALDFSPPTMPAGYVQRDASAPAYAQEAATAKPADKPAAASGYASEAGPGHFPETARGEPLDFDVSLPTALDFDLSVPQAAPADKAGSHEAEAREGDTASKPTKR